MMKYAKQPTHARPEYSGQSIIRWLSAALLCCLLPLAASAETPSREELLQKLESLNKELAATKAALRQSEEKRLAAEKAAQTPASEKVGVLEEQIANAADMGPAKITPGDLFPVLEGLKIGGAIRANYYVGDYNGQDFNGNDLADDANRSEDGTISLDTFRINMDYERGPWIGKFEYRFYPGYSSSNSDSYHFLHTGWVGYNFDNAGQLQVGVNRVPFGPGAYGVSQSWFFDQHYYAGLSDDMDFGIKYTDSKGDWTFDLAYYYSDEGSYFGENFSNDSVRYSYDVVDDTCDGFF